MKALVLGASGVTGKSVVRQLVKRQSIFFSIQFR
jgi:uncharacterized protein YbjT (DUF2867 family)